MGFEIFFGFFLSIPNIWKENLHGIVVTLFALFGVSKFIVEARYLTTRLK
jgi:hypothetical protein